VFRDCRVPSYTIRWQQGGRGIVLARIFTGFVDSWNSGRINTCLWLGVV
jgi:hypothetical protein